MTALVALLVGARATIFAALCVALTATLAIVLTQLSNARDKIAADAVTIANFETAQKASLGTIEELRETNAAWARKCAVDPAASAKAQQDTEQDSGALPADDQRRNDDRGQLYEQDGDAAAWGRARVPAAAARRLRQ